jgi:energy-coupling factor transporter ATP-binding protein EcfA2
MSKSDHQNNNNIFINDKLYLPPFKLTSKNILNKSIVLYGSRGSGKSIICKDIMYILKDEIPNAIIFNTTESSNCFFSNIVPNPFLYNYIDLDVLNNIWKRQENITEIYKKINSIDILLKIIYKLRFKQAINIIDNIDKNKEKRAENLQNNIKADTSFLIEINKLNDKFNEVKLCILKKIMQIIKKKIKNNQLDKSCLSPEELDIIKFNDINPNILLIFDDCAAEFKKYNKSDTLRKLFYQSRHVNITFVITAQDEIDLDASLRKNANITILCDSNCCNGFFERASNAFGKRLKQLTREISDVIYNNEIKNIKLIYNKDSDDNKILWYIATLRGDFIFGSKFNLAYAKKIVKEKDRDISILIKKL